MPRRKKKKLNRSNGVGTKKRATTEYGSGQFIPLLTPLGRILLMILENPDTSINDLAAKLGQSTQLINRAVLQLIEGGVLVRTGRGDKVHYEVNMEKGLQYPDVHRFCTILLPLVVGEVEYLD